VDIIWHEDASRVYQDMSTAQKERIKDDVKLLRRDPLAGEHLNRELYCNRKMRTNDYRLVYKFLENQDMLVVTGLGHKPQAYAMAAIAKVWELARSAFRRRPSS